MIPPGLTRCDTCGEQRGTSYFSEPYVPELLTRTEISCICDGIRCRCCDRGMIRRPISNYWDEKRSRVVHVPWFGGYTPCPDCRAAGRRLCL